ncbi:MAG: DUF4340 domain-containing protein [Polyangiaceae bacterium]
MKTSPRRVGESRRSSGAVRQTRIESITLTSEDRIVKIVPKKDPVGRYGIVEVTKLGNSNDTKSAASSSEPPKPEAPKRFISVDAVEMLLPALAPAKSYRAIGKLDAKRLTDYGLEKPDSFLEVRIGGRVHKLDIGGLTPGSGDYYVRSPATGEVNTFTAEAITRMKYGESRLQEHDLHGFKVDDVQAVWIVAGDKLKKLKRLESKSAWADSSTPDKADETASNWLLKVQRLRPTSYLETVPSLGSSFVRVEYRDAKSQLGYVDLFRSTGAELKYYGRSERSRWYVELPKALVEPVDQDLGTVLK